VKRKMKHKKIVFLCETSEDWITFYIIDDEILGVALPKAEYPTIKDFANALSKCEDATIDPQDIIGAKILAVKEVE
jgi:hypothetical protein